MSVPTIPIYLTSKLRDKFIIFSLAVQDGKAGKGMMTDEDSRIIATGKDLQ
jgi:hypothetical protein